jgi:hypothetical protein
MMTTTTTTITNEVKNENGNEKISETKNKTENITKKCVLSFDPGLINLAMWKGYPCERSGIPHTVTWMKIDITKYDTLKHIKEYLPTVIDQFPDLIKSTISKDVICHNSKAAYACVINFLSVNIWLFENVGTIIIETQDPGNVPGRIVASSIYSFARGILMGKDVEIKFCNNRSKANAKMFISDKLTIPFDQSECIGTSQSRQAYRKTKETSYEMCKEWISKYGSQQDRNLINIYSMKRGIMKGDDLAEAFLLGFAEIIHNSNREGDELDASKMIMDGNGIRKRKSIHSSKIPRKRQKKISIGDIINSNLSFDSNLQEPIDEEINGKC